jgi:hypothetical protein
LCHSKRLFELITVPSQIEKSPTEVYASPLLHHLERNAKHDPAEVAVGRAPTTGEATQPASLHVP